MRNVAPYEHTRDGWRGTWTLRVETILTPEHSANRQVHGDQPGTVVFYREEPGGILISRILHQRMLPENQAIEGLHKGSCDKTQ
jgi:plasmid stabilization system protein ParE